MSTELLTPLDRPPATTGNAVASPARSAELTSYFGPFVVVAAFVGLAAWTWRTWPDLLVDFGRELYVPWQLSQGAVLYRDVAYFNGPLSPLWNALVFRTFGVSLLTLVAVNAAILGLLTAILYRRIAGWTNQLTATLACLVLLAAFGFADLVTIGNYNYICPYSHELTHGVVLLMAMWALLTHGGRAPAENNWPTRRAAAAGLCWGLTFLGKAEIFVAATAVAGFCLAWPVVVNRQNWRENVCGVLVLISVGCLPAIAAIFYLAQSMPLSVAVAGVAGSWRWILTNDVANNHFYRVLSGFDNPLANVLAMLRASAGLGLLVAAAVLYDRWAAAERTDRRWFAAAAACLAGALVLRGWGFPYLLDGQVLLVTSAAITFDALLVAWRTRRDAHRDVRLMGLAAWGVMATALLAKIALAPRVHHYGFVLAMPAALLLVTVLVGLLPAALTRYWQGGIALRRAMVMLLLADVLGYTLMSSANVRYKTLAIGTGADRIATWSAERNPAGPAVAQLLGELEATLPQGATFMVMPEGIMLNYLTRRATGSPYTNLMPPELAMYGEANIVASLAARPPDYVVLVHKDTSEYGVGLFGSADYGRDILDWVRKNYAPVNTIGREPLRDEQFGIQILRRANLGAPRHGLTGLTGG